MLSLLQFLFYLCKYVYLMVIDMALKSACPQHYFLKYLDLELYHAIIPGYNPMALTPIVLKCFKRLVLALIKNNIHPTLNQHQFAYRPNRSTEYAISLVIHTTLSHLEHQDNYVRIMLSDSSSDFNTIPPSS